MRYLSFSLDKEYFAVDVMYVEKVVRKIAVTPIPAAPEDIIGIVNMKGRVVTLLSLYKLLKRRERRGGERITHAANTIIFKSFSGGEDQMGFLIGKPGSLIHIDDSDIRLPSLTADIEENFCISGVAETGGKLYRIINIIPIITMHKQSGDGITDAYINGGENNEE